MSSNEPAGSTGRLLFSPLHKGGPGGSRLGHSPVGLFVCWRVTCPRLCVDMLFVWLIAGR